MTEEKRKEFGRRGQAPPVVTHAPKGLAGVAGGPSGLRKRTIAIALVAAGTVSIGTYALVEASRRDCAKDGEWGQDGKGPDECRHSSSGSHGGSSGRSWWWGSSSHSSSSGASSGSGSSAHGASFFGHGVSFGGFGGHFGGGS